MVCAVHGGCSSVCWSGGRGDYRGVLWEYREGVGSRVGEFEGLRFDPFDDEVRRTLGTVPQK